jgi:hypothetical protein
LKNAHTLKGTIVCGVVLQNAPLNVFLYTPRGSVFARLASEHFLTAPEQGVVDWEGAPIEQPLSSGLFNIPICKIYSFFSSLHLYT